jgi:hypothetical protein
VNGMSAGAAKTSSKREIQARRPIPAAKRTSPRRQVGLTGAVTDSSSALVGGARPLSGCYGLSREGPRRMLDPPALPDRAPRPHPDHEPPRAT